MSNREARSTICVLISNITDANKPVKRIFGQFVAAKGRACCPKAKSKEKGEIWFERCVEIRGKQLVRTFLRPRTAALRRMGNTP